MAQSRARWPRDRGARSPSRRLAARRSRRRSGSVTSLLTSTCTARGSDAAWSVTAPSSDQLVCRASTCRPPGHGHRLARSTGWRAGDGLRRTDVVDAQGQRERAELDVLLGVVLQVDLHRVGCPGRFGGRDLVGEGAVALHFTTVAPSKPARPPRRTCLLMWVGLPVTVEGRRALAIARSLPCAASALPARRPAPRRSA